MLFSSLVVNDNGWLFCWRHRIRYPWVCTQFHFLNLKLTTGCLHVSMLLLVLGALGKLSHAHHPFIIIIRRLLRPRVTESVFII